MAPTRSIKPSEKSTKKPPARDASNINPKKEINVLDPTEALVQYYRKWVADFENDRKKLEIELDRLSLEKSHATCDVEREDLVRKVLDAKQQISELKTSTHAEQRESLKLLQCNESLKGDLLLMEKKLTIMQSITEVSDEDLDSFCKSSKITKLLKSKYRFKLRVIKEQLKNFSENITDDTPEIHILKGKLKLLETEKHEMKKLFLKEIDDLREERKLHRIEIQTFQEESRARNGLLSAKLDHAEEMLQQKQRRINSLVSEKQQLQERKFAEIDRILSTTMKKTHGCEDKENVGDIYFTTTTNTEECPTVLRRQISKLKKQLTEQEELRNLYEDRCNKFERRFCKLREEKESAVESYQTKLKRCKDRLDLSEKQKSRLAAWKRKQFEGFSSDLKLLKDQLKKVIQQLFKITNYLTSTSGETSNEALSDIKTASSLARTVHLTLADSRKRLMQLESKPPDNI